MMSFYGSTDEWGEAPYKNWSLDSESQSDEPTDHVDDFGNTPSVWKPASAVTSTDEWSTIPLPERDENWLKKTEPKMRRGGRNPYIGTDEEVLPEVMTPSAPAALDYLFPYDPTPRAAEPKAATPENTIPPGKTFWDKITPGGSTTPGEMFGDISPSDVIKPFMPWTGLAAEGIENTGKATRGIAGALPLFVLLMAMKD